MSVDFHDIALIGFAPSEYATFETFFRLVSSRRPKPYRAVREVEGAALVLVNATSTPTVTLVVDAMREGQRLITIGTITSEWDWRHLDRPINLNAVLVALDAAFKTGNVVESSSPTLARPPALNAPPVETVSRAPIVTAPAPTPIVRPAAPVAPPYMPPLTKPASSPVAVPPVRTSAPQPLVRPAVAPAANNVSQFPVTPRVVPRAPASASSQVAAPVPVAAPASTTPAGNVRILVVDDSDVALKFIHSRLSAFGFQVDQCSSGEEALVRITDGGYNFVFLDVMMEGLDGYQTCKAIKGRRYAGGRAPVVVMLTSRGGTIDKVRGTFAGCDAYLTKPLDESKMLKVLLKHDSALGESISTLSHTQMQTPTVREPSKSNPLAASYESLSNRAS